MGRTGRRCLAERARGVIVEVRGAGIAVRSRKSGEAAAGTIEIRVSATAARRRVVELAGRSRGSRRAAAQAIAVDTAVTEPNAAADIPEVVRRTLQVALLPGSAFRAGRADAIGNIRNDPARMARLEEAAQE
jgi:hypothetical protein